MLAMLAPVLRRSAAAAASGGGCYRLALQPLDVVAPAATQMRCFSAGPAPKQKSSKMRKKLRNGICIALHPRFLSPPASCLLSAWLSGCLTPQQRTLCCTRSGAASAKPNTKSSQTSGVPAVWGAETSPYLFMRLLQALAEPAFLTSAKSRSQ